MIALCGALAGEVRAGHQPGEALRRAAHDSGGLDEAQAVVLAAARFGGDVPGALTDAARQPGADGLVGLAACWRVAVDRARAWRRASTAWKGRCARSGTNGPICAPNWRDRDPRR